MRQALLGVLVIIMIVLVFSAEGILSLLRVRTITASVQVTDVQGGAQVTAVPETPQPGKPAVLIITPHAALSVRVHWDYQIGPRFPQTTVLAQALDQKQVVVASAKYVIDCGSNTLNCAGDHPLALSYGVQEKASDQNQQKVQAADWVVGDYTLQVTRTYADLKPQDVLSETLRVLPTP